MTGRAWMLATVALLCAVPAAAQTGGSQSQVEDSTFTPRVGRPAFTDQHPIVYLDQAHHNYNTMTKRYRAFAELMSADGMRVFPGVQPFSAPYLRNCQVLVLANALGAEQTWDPVASQPALTTEECDAVVEWVRGGGALLLVADHAPFASAIDNLALRLGVDMAKGYTMDDRRVDPETGNPGCILYTRAKGLILDHPVTLGRDAGERVDTVVTFTGQSLTGPQGSVPFLSLSETARDIPLTGDRGPLPAAGDSTADDLERRTYPAAGRAQGLAFTFGKGRVVVLGEAAMFGAQLLLGIPAERMHKTALRLGMNRPDLHNQRLALNVMRWLGGALD